MIIFEFIYKNNKKESKGRGYIFIESLKNYFNKYEEFTLII